MPNSKFARAQKRNMKKQLRDGNNHLIKKMKADDELVEGVEGDSSVPVFDDSFFDFEYDDYFGMTEVEIDAVASVPWLTWKSEIVKEQKVHYMGTSRQTLRRKELKAIEEKKKGQAGLLSFGFNRIKEVAVSNLNEDTSGRKEKKFIRQNKLNQWKEAVEKLETILNCTISNDNTSMKNIEVLKHRAAHLYLKNLIDGLNQGQSSVNAANIIWLGKASEVYRPKAIVGWAKQFLEYGIISPRRQGCHIKRQSFLADEDVKNAVIGWIRDQRSESLSLISLKKFIEESIVPEYLSVAGSVSEGTVRNYLHLWGYTYKPNNKDIYFDGHEREDVVVYRKEWCRRMIEHMRYMDRYVGGDLMVVEGEAVRSGGKKRVLVTHDECTFYANDGKSEMWIRQGENPIRKKGPGMSIMVSEFQCSCHGTMRVKGWTSRKLFEAGAGRHD